MARYNLKSMCVCMFMSVHMCDVFRLEERQLGTAAPLEFPESI